MYFLRSNFFSRGGEHGVRKVTHSVRKVTHGVRKVTHSVRKVTHSARTQYQTIADMFVRVVPPGFSLVQTMMTCVQTESRALL